MNTATQIGLGIFVCIILGLLIVGWFAVCWIIQDKLEAKYERRLPFSGLGIYLLPVIGVGLICLCYGLVVQPKTTKLEEPMKDFRTDEDRRVAEHMFNRSMRLLIKHYRNDDSISQDVIEVINNYENLNGKAENENDEY